LRRRFFHHFATVIGTVSGADAGLSAKGGWLKSMTVISVVGDLETTKAVRFAAGRLLLCGGLDQPRLLPSAVFTDGHTLAPRGELDKLWALTSGDNALAGAAGKPVQLAPFLEIHHTIVVHSKPP
jgi:hypothetical protein